MASTKTDSGSDVLTHLRTATRALHTRIDTGLPLARHNATLADYGAHVRLVHAWMTRMTATLAAFDDAPAHFGSVSNRNSTAWLAADVGAAGLQPGASDGAADTAAVPSALAEPAFRWGMQYVIEGSYMGAGFLHRRYAPLFPDCPMVFFTHVSAINTQRWSAFGLAIRAAVDDPAGIALAAEGATYAFHRFMHLADAGQPNPHLETQP